MKTYVSPLNHRHGAFAAVVVMVALSVVDGAFDVAVFCSVLVAAALFGAMIASYSRTTRPAMRRRPVAVPVRRASPRVRALPLGAATARA